MNVMLTDDYVLVNGSNTDIININDNNSYNNNININDNNNENKENQPLLSHSHGNVQVSAKVAVWNLYADVLGPGAVALPFYITQSGLGAGCLLILVMAFLSSVTLDDIHLMYTRLGKHNYPDLCRAVLGRPGYFVVCFAIFCFNFGGLCGQLMLFGTVVPDIMMDLFGVHPLFNKTYLILLACVIFLPISLLKDIAKFSFVSLISVSCIFVIAGLLFFRLMFKKVGDFDIPGQGGDHGDTNPYAFVHYSVFSSLGGLAYVFVCHDLSFNVIGSLKNPTTRRYRGVVAATMLGTIATCSLIGFSGYLLFFHEVKANIFENFPRKDAVATIGRCILALCITLAIPFTCFMPRVSLDAVISSMGEGAKKWAHSNFGHFIETILVLGSAVGIAIVVNNLGDVFELVGGVSACTLAFLLPPILIFKSIGISHLSFIKVVITILVFVAGLIILVGTLVDVFLFPSS